jgi:tetratricopeptide (TPR) repeat protein
MAKKRNITIILTLFFLGLVGYAQEETTAADVTNEVVTDAFQEKFFEALKQRATENYDRAIEVLLECKNLQPTNVAVDYELGKNHFLLRQYAVAQNYLEVALKAEPDNLWFLEALLLVYKTRGDLYNTLNVDKQLNIQSKTLRENLAKIYTEFGDYEQAIIVLNELDKKYGVTTERKNLRALIKSYVYAAQQKENNVEVVIKKDNDNPVEQYKGILEKLIALDDKQALLKVSTEALESFPTQPYFYYANGLALNKVTQYKKAAEILESALDFLIDDAKLQNNIYKQLAVAYSSLGENQKAEQYLQKTKNGL